MIDFVCWIMFSLTKYYHKHTMTEMWIHKENNAFDLIVNENEDLYR